MKCPCGGTIGVTHTYAVDTKKFQRAYCLKCKLVYCLETLMHQVGARGSGAKARAQRAEKEKVR